MTPTTILLFVVILLLVYVLYAYLTGTVTKMSQNANLNAAIPAITKIDGATNTRYGYSIWVYVNTWNNTGAKTIFSRSNNIKLYLDNTSPTLKLDLTMADATSSSTTMVVTNNFPLQKWVCIGVSVDNQFVDAYLDGKLVKSQRFYKSTTSTATPPVTTVSIPKTPSDATVSPVYLGNSAGAPFAPFDAFIAEFKRWSAPIDPQSAWDTYLEGNGTNGVSRAFSSYGIDVSVLRNKVEQARVSF
jgi:hypothetical protein